MGFTLEELIANSPRNEVRSSKITRSNNNNGNGANNATLLEALAKSGNVTSHTTEDGKVKIKILVKKQDLSKMIETLSNGNNDRNDSKSTFLPGKSSSTSIERRLYDLMKVKKAKQANMERQSNYNWRPALQSIPEEYGAF